MEFVKGLISYSIKKKNNFILILIFHSSSKGGDFYHINPKELLGDAALTPQGKDTLYHIGLFLFLCHSVTQSNIKYIFYFLNIDE